MEKPRQRRRIRNIQIGETYNHLRVESFEQHITKVNNRTYTYAICTCLLCGNITGPIRTCNVKSGWTKSCGCLVKNLTHRSGPQARFMSAKEVIANYLFGVYKAKARNYKQTFDLTIQQFTALVTTDHCYYCGTGFTNMSFSRRFNEWVKYNGVDRVDTSKGYTIDNCVSCCKTCNISKLAQTRTHFLAWIKRVYEHNFTPRQEVPLAA